MTRVTPEPRTAPLVPSYGSRTLAELGSSVLAAVGGSGTNPPALPLTRKVCLLVVDGLGWELLRDHPAAAPFLNELAMNAQPLAAGCPATTVPSLTSLGSGSAPGQHGVLGYQVAIPGEHKLLNGLRWDDRIDPVRWQPRPTNYHLAHVDKLAEQLAGALPSETILYITADHGMVDVSAEDRIDVDDSPDLRAGVSLLGGEPRARHVYTRPEAAADVLAAWREVLGNRAWVVSREEAIKENWFGPVG